MSDVLGGANVMQIPRRLGTVHDVAQMCGLSWRTALRKADEGRMPWGIKIGALRRWDLDEIAAWIDGGCKSVRPIKGGVK